MEHNYIAGLLVGALLGLVVAVIGSAFDPSVDNRYAKLSGLGVFVIVFLAVSGLVAL